jgi:protein-L-isoaspartate(D-aspartate) O-methyltransferase
MRALQEARLHFAEDVRRRANVQTAALVEALATVPREGFLPPGPWTVRGGGGAHTTPDADPRHLY